jgi:hypothetical protein
MERGIKENHGWEGMCHPLIQKSIDAVPPSHAESCRVVPSRAQIFFSVPMAFGSIKNGFFQSRHCCAIAICFTEFDLRLNE